MGGPNGDRSLPSAGTRGVKTDSVVDRAGELSGITTAVLVSWFTFNVVPFKYEAKAFASLE
jgi:hypothetical protein